MPACVQGLGSATKNHSVTIQISQFGDVAHNFNMLWCDCLNKRAEAKFTHFAMLHSDIRACPMWLDVLVDEMDRVNADVMTTIMPIKDARGLTTTGIRYPGVWGTRRFTMNEVMKYPQTFSIEDVGDPKDECLAINTGCWVARIDSGWADVFPGFTDNYRIRSVAGMFYPDFDSEDWLFSEWAANKGLKVYATRKVEAYHIGAFEYGNATVWGSNETDVQAPIKPITEKLKSLSAPHISIETKKPVAVDSLDHTRPYGTAQDNSVSPFFNQKLFELIPAEKVRLLDLGCAGGGLVRSILQAGGFAVGIEGSDFSKIHRRAEWGVIPDWLFTADATEPFQLHNGKPLKFNVITGWEFLEHISKEKLPTVLENIKKHATEDAIFVGSISRGQEPHHITVNHKGWWVDFLANLGLEYSPVLEQHFGDNLVRGSSHPMASSFSYAAHIKA